MGVDEPRESSYANVERKFKCHAYNPSNENDSSTANIYRTRECRLKTDRHENTDSRKTSTITRTKDGTK